MEHDLRLTVRGTVLHAVDWVPWLAGRGPSRRLLADAAARDPTLAFADADVVRRRDVAVELVVVELAGARDVLRGPVVAWAALVGYARVWLPDELVAPVPAPGGRVGTRCPACHGDFAEDGGHFWDLARRNGRFPCTCPWCGAGVPQWTPARQASCEPVSSWASRTTPPA